MKSSKENAVVPKKKRRSGESVSKEGSNEKEVRLSIYEGVDTDDKQSVKTTKEQDEWNSKMNQAQDWYVRCSWINKFLLLESLCQMTSGLLVLQSVLKYIKSIMTKDTLESIMNDKTEFGFDKIPNDDDRSIPAKELDESIQDIFSWFVNLERTKQTTVILKLLRLGGGGLIFMIYKSVTILYEDRKAKTPEVSFEYLGSLDSNTKLDREESEVSPLVVSKESSEDQFPSKFTFFELSYKKLDELMKRAVELEAYKKLKGIIEEQEKIKKKQKRKQKKKENAKEVIDYLQILPIGLNRKIMLYVDEKSLQEFKKVGKYWGKMIDESVNEKSGRQAINAKIKKLIGTSFGKKTRKSQGNTKRGIEKEDNDNDNDKEVNNYDNYEIVLGAKAKQFFKENHLSEKVLKNWTVKYENVLSGKFKIFKIEKTSFSDCCCCWDKKIEMMACSTASNVIHFYSVKTGTRLNFSVFGFESAITCLALHESRTRVIIGCQNGAVISKFVKNNRTNFEYEGHSEPVKWLFTNHWNLLSSSSDNTIRYYQMWSGVCLLSFDLSQDFFISSILLSDRNTSSCIVGTREGILTLVDLENNSFIRKAKLHSEEITALAQEDNVLITVGKSGKMRVWNLKQLEDNSNDLYPYYEIDAGDEVTSIFMYLHQIFFGCRNGIVQIASLANGKTFKTFPIVERMPILGLAVTEDDSGLRIIIWHAEGIEIRSFNLEKFPSSKKSVKKNDAESKQKAPREAKKSKFLKMVSETAIKGL